MDKTTPSEHRPRRPRIEKGPLKPPQRPPAAISYAQPPLLKNEIFIEAAGTQQASVGFREVSFTSVPQPFVNPADAFSNLNAGGSSGGSSGGS